MLVVPDIVGRQEPLQTSEIINEKPGLIDRARQMLDRAFGKGKDQTPTVVVHELTDEDVKLAESLATASDLRLRINRLAGVKPWEASHALEKLQRENRLVGIE